MPLCFRRRGVGANSRAEREDRRSTCRTGAPRQAPDLEKVSCSNSEDGLDCRAVQSLQMTNSGQASVAVHLPPDTKKPDVLVPMGIYLPAGVTLQFGQGEAKKAPLRSCDSSGCLAEYSPSDVELGAMSEGQPLVVAVQDGDQKPVTLQVPSTGFAAAYAKIK